MNPDEDMDERATDDIGAVQGTEPEQDASVAPATPSDAETGVAAAAPDAGEIEWAGGAIRKAPGGK